MVKRKSKRIGRKKLLAFFTPIGVIIAIVGFVYNNLKDSAIQVLVFHVRTILKLDEKSSWPLIILVFASLAVILLVSFFFTRAILHYNTPNRKYFELIDFKHPDDDVIRAAAEGILNSEKTQPFFVHAAPLNDEIEQFYDKLDSEGFVWENGKPGDGKSMLAYNALYRYREKISLQFDVTRIVLFKVKYKSYALKLKNITEEKEIDSILEELDWLKGGKRKIILIDDAHKLSFESKLRWEFEEEAKEKINGKFVWINTNYLDKNPVNDESLSISFKDFYPKLLRDLYESKHPVIREVVSGKCTALEEAKKLTDSGRIKDPWHFNFIATEGEKRITDLLGKLHDNKVKQDVLILSMFLFSFRNIITGEKEINQTAFFNLLTSIDDVYFKDRIKEYGPENIILDLASQDKGRFLIIEDKNSLDRGFLRAPHYKHSISIISSIVTQFNDEKLISHILNSSKILLSENYADCKYFGIFFNKLGIWQEYFLIENKNWVTLFLSNIVLDQLHVYPYLLRVIKKYHPGFYKENLSVDYSYKIAPHLSLAPANKFKFIQEFLNSFGGDKDVLIQKLDWEVLAISANNTKAAHLHQVSELINALGYDKKRLLEKLDWNLLAKVANSAEVVQLHQVADFIKALGDDKLKIIEKLNLDLLASKANKADVSQFSQLATFIRSLSSKKNYVFLKLDFEKLAGPAEMAEVSVFGQKELIKILGNYRERFINRLNWAALANAANKADASHFSHLEALINALGIYKERLIEKLNWEIIAIAANKATVSQFKPIADFINSLGQYKGKLIEKLNWDLLGQTASRVGASQLSQLESILNSLEADKGKLLCKFDWDELAISVNKVKISNFGQLAAFLNAIEYEKEKILKNFNWQHIARQANQAEVSQLKLVADFIIVLGSDKTKLTKYFDIEYFLKLSSVLTGNHIIPFCIIVAGLDREMQDVVIFKCNWSDLLLKLNLDHSLKIKTLSFILEYQNKKHEVTNDIVEYGRIKETLESNSDKIIHFYSEFFIWPNDIRIVTSLLKNIFPYSPEICRSLVLCVKKNLLDGFNINVFYYTQFSHLLDEIFKIEPEVCQIILSDISVRSKLIESLDYAMLNGYREEIYCLLNTIKSQHADLFVEISRLDNFKEMNYVEDV